MTLARPRHAPASPLSRRRVVVPARPVTSRREAAAQPTPEAPFGPSSELLEAMDRIGIDRLQLDVPASPDAADDPWCEALARLLGRLEREVGALRQFSSDAAHQLRTPMAVLSARTNAPAEELDREGLAGDLRWMGRLIDQLLATTRSTIATIDPDERFSTRELCVDVVSALVPLAISRGRDLQLVHAERDATVAGSYELAFEALSNLVENALDHSPPGTMVSVRLHESRVEVADRGAGVPEAEREAIFERFRQGARETTGGAGLGLAIVREIMERHGGTVTCDRDRNGGALFALTFVPASATGRSAPDKDRSAPDTDRSVPDTDVPPADANRTENGGPIENGGSDGCQLAESRACDNGATPVRTCDKEAGP